jgi:hypothetical protein
MLALLLSLMFSDTDKVASAWAVAWLQVEHSTGENLSDHIHAVNYYTNLQGKQTKAVAAVQPQQKQQCSRHLLKPWKPS